MHLLWNKLGDRFIEVIETTVDESNIDRHELGNTSNSVLRVRVHGFDSVLSVGK